MSRQDLSTSPYRPRYVRILLSAFAFPVTLYLLFVAPQIGDWGAYAGRLFRAPHAPDLGVMAAAPIAVQAHVGAILAALAAGLVLLAGVKGTRLHRLLGWACATAFCIGAFASVFIRTDTGASFNGLGPLHVFSALGLALVPLALWAARRHKVELHSRIMASWFLGGMLAAGTFAFLPGRLMWDVFFG